VNETPVQGGRLSKFSKPRRPMRIAQQRALNWRSPLKRLTTLSPFKPQLPLSCKNSRHLTKCYNDTIEVRKGLTRYKHWFQYDNVTKYPKDALVLAQFRNPYDWYVPTMNAEHMRASIFRDDKLTLLCPCSGPYVHKYICIFILRTRTLHTLY
jgi:hypothetical protein